MDGQTSKTCNVDRRIISKSRHNKIQKLTAKILLNDYSFAHLTLILSLHYFVKCRSRSLAIHNNEFILGSACISKDMINWIVTTTSNSYYLSKSYMLYHIIFITACAQNVLLQHERKRIVADATRECSAHSIMREVWWAKLHCVSIKSTTFLAVTWKPIIRFW